LTRLNYSKCVEFNFHLLFWYSRSFLDQDKLSGLKFEMDRQILNLLIR